MGVIAAWLNFEESQQVLPTVSLFVMQKRGLSFPGVYETEGYLAPLPVVAIGDIAVDFRSGALGYIVVGTGCQGCGTANSNWTWPSEKSAVTGSKPESWRATSRRRVSGERGATGSSKGSASAIYWTVDLLAEEHRQ